MVHVASKDSELMSGHVSQHIVYATVCHCFCVRLHLDIAFQSLFRSVCYVKAQVDKDQHQTTKFMLRLSTQHDGLCRLLSCACPSLFSFCVSKCTWKLGDGTVRMSQSNIIYSHSCHHLSSVASVPVFPELAIQCHPCNKH